MIGSNEQLCPHCVCSSEHQRDYDSTIFERLEGDAKTRSSRRVREYGDFNLRDEDHTNKTLQVFGEG